MNSTPALSQIRVLIVDDHAVVRAGFRMLIEDQQHMTVVGEAGNRSDALRIAAGERPDVVLLDLDLGTENGLDFLPELVRAAPDAQVLVLTCMRDIKTHHRAVQLGATGLVLKDKTSDVLIKAIERVHAGEAWLDRSIMAQALGGSVTPAKANRNDTSSARIATLTAREREVITLVAGGLTTKQIADRLFISEKTVRNHLASIYSKLGISYRLELAVYAYQNGLSDPPTGN
ncbi:MAG TPA: response regulator transcription factor [Blastocatellia bacterium]|nr:response regulator transcription factor [Blastocatellia bacterium]